MATIISPEFNSARKGAAKTAKISARAVSAHTKKSRKRARMAAYGLGGVAMFLTGLSLSDLAAGVQIVTKCADWQSVLMAIGVDGGYISLESAMILAPSEHVRRIIGPYASWGVRGTLVASAAMNAFAFGHGQDGAMLAASIGIGIGIPMLIYALTQAATRLWLAVDK